MRFKQVQDGYVISVSRKKDRVGSWVANMEGAKYLSTSMSWFIPNTAANRKVLQEKKLLEIPNSKSVLPVLTQNYLQYIPKEAFPYQIDGVQRIYGYRGSGLVAFDVGLGKTLTSVSCVLTCLPAFNLPTRVLYVVPAAIKRQWYKELQHWGNFTDIQIIYGQQPTEITSDHVIVNYEILQYHIDAIKSHDFSMLIVDECQKLANPKAIRTKTVKKLSRWIQCVVMLSGTPITRRPVQFYPVLNMLRPDLFPNEWKYKMRYCGAHIGKNGWDFDGASNIDELHEILISAVMVRKTKTDADVVGSLPKKRVLPVPLEMNKEDMDIYLAEQENIQQVERKKLKDSFHFLQYLAFEAKKKEMFEWLDLLLDSGEKVLIICRHRKVVKTVKEYYGDNCVTYYGGDTDIQKDTNKKKFLQDAQVMIGNDVALTGMDSVQTVCNIAVFIEIPWVPTTFDQAMGRIWRTGQKRTSNVFVLYAENSIEENIMKILDKSRDIVNTVIDGKKAEDIDMLTELIKLYR